MASTIRSAQPDDRDAILEVVQAAFTRDGRDGQEELDIVEATWAAQAVPDGLELVADADGAIVGHVLGATGDLGGHEVIGVAPLGVIPERQGRGIGTALMIELLRRAEAGGWPAVVLLGRPSYYGRFGFEPSGPLDVVYPPVGPDNPHFQLARLPGFTESMTGVFTYCWER